MPVDWPFSGDLVRLGGIGTGRISPEDGARQEATARSILADFKVQPGVVLADEVGMGKTYVALAVVSSVVLATRQSGRPVVVMVPPGLSLKWRREWNQFRSLCTAAPGALAWVRDAYADSPTDFFKFLLAPRPRRPHIIWMTTGCFGRGLADPWTKLALVRLARTKTKLDAETKKRLSKWATTLVRLKRKWRLTPALVERLLHSGLSRWHRILIREGILAEDSDDPIAQLLVQHRKQIDFAPLIAVLRGEAIPGRRGAVSTERLRAARGDFNEACQDVYWDWLSCVKWRAPLLILDEAHHAKNDNTRLASLLRSEDTRRLVEGEKGIEPLLWGKFERMLFLTATPFQLGHHELIRVLRSFAAAKWSGDSAPVGTREEFMAAMDKLEERLSANLLAGKRLDRLWGRLARDAVSRGGGDGNLAQAAEDWWQHASSRASDDPIERELHDAITQCRTTKEQAERDPEQPGCALRAWVIRHNRPASIPGEVGGVPIPRRTLRPGRAIAGSDGQEGGGASAATTPVTGLPIDGEAALPFLLAARAQGELAQGSAKGRAFFAEGLCSSYEAFHHTRANRGDARDVDDDGVERAIATERVRAQPLVPVTWYEEQVSRLIPSKQAEAGERYQHPKMQAVVRRTVDLWLAGEKVLLFCFYRETAKALRQHIGREVEHATFRLAAEKLGLDASRDDSRIRDWFERVARRLSEKDSPFHRAIDSTLREPLRSEEFSVLHSRADDLIQLLAAYVRSPSFIARYLPFDIPQVREALSDGSARVQVVRAGAKALARALNERADASAMTMPRRVEEFYRFAKELEEQTRPASAPDDNDARAPLNDYLDAVAVYISPRRATKDDDDEARASTAAGSYRVLQPTRMVFGDTKRAVRERLMLAFNSPMFPEILISSAVLGEGVDLHRFCRYVIHHDLCWNPSTIEQRTGRLDRIRCKAELAHRPIVVYEPFLGGSADEKMFRVVRDRERWFQIVMGQRFAFDEATSERLADRVPLPQKLAAELVFDLRRYRIAESTTAAAGSEANLAPQGVLR